MKTLLFVFFAAVVATSWLRAEPDDEVARDRPTTHVERPERHLAISHARIAIGAILSEFDDTWALQKVEYEWRNGGYALLFHFQTNDEAGMVVSAWIDLKSGRVLRVEQLEETQMEQILRADHGEIGNVAAVKICLPEPEEERDVLNQFFRDIAIVRERGIIFLRERVSLLPTSVGGGSVTYLLDAQRGDILSRGFGDPLENHTLKEDILRRLELD